MYLKYVKNILVKKSDIEEKQKLAKAYNKLILNHFTVGYEMFIIIFISKQIV